MDKIVLVFMSAMIFGTVVMAFTLLLQYTVYSALPASYWFKYYSVTPEKEEFLVGEEIKFISDSVTFRENNMRWNDILFCKSDQWGHDKFVNFSSYDSAHAHKTPSDRTEKEWRYGESVSTVDSVCYLESNIIAEVPFGIQKKQTYIGPEFKIVSQ